MEKRKIENYLWFTISLIVGLLCVGSFLFLGIVTGEWFGHWTFEPMIFFLFLGMVFLILSFSYFLNIKGVDKWGKIIRIIISTIFIIIVVGFILSSFLIMW